MKKDDIIVRNDQHFPADALMVHAVHPTHVFAFPMGGGFQMRIPAADLSQFRVVPAEEKAKPRYYRALFDIEGIDGIFAGWTDGSLWNGWSKPLFDCDEGKLICEAFGEPNHYDSDADVFLTDSHDCRPDEWKPEEITVDHGEKITVYPIGTGCWVWDERWNVKTGADHVMKNVSTDYRAYARDKARGNYRGFAALHDKCDANMLLPAVEEFNGNSEAQCRFHNAVMDEVTRRILA